jgi:hypothetical protein
MVLRDEVEPPTPGLFQKRLSSSITRRSFLLLSSGAMGKDLKGNSSTILLLPSSAERFIQLDEASVFIAARGGERQFCAVE